MQYHPIRLKVHLNTGTATILKFCHHGFSFTQFIVQPLYNQNSNKSIPRVNSVQKSLMHKGLTRLYKAQCFAWMSFTLAQCVHMVVKKQRATAQITHRNGT